MPSNDEIYAALTEIFSDIFMRDDIVLRPDLSARDVKEWDSFRQIDIIMATEERFGIRMTTKELDSLQTVGDLVAVIAAKAA